MQKLSVSAPGRICLFGEHQDYLNMAVVAAAIDRRFYIEGAPRRDSIFRIDMPDIRRSDEINLSKPIVYGKKRDYLRSCVNVLRREGWDLSTGFDCRMTSTIPINAGVSSSSAMIVAWLTFLLNAAGQWEGFSRHKLACLAHSSEVVEFDEPGGMMDQYTSSMGNVVFIDTRPPYSAEYLDVNLTGFVLGDSQEKKHTLGILGVSRAAANEGIKLLENAFPGFDLQTTPSAEIMPLVDKLPERMSKMLRANLINRDIRIEAVQMLKGGVIDPIRLGELFTLHHEQLRDGVGVSTEKMDRMCEASLHAGALGAKMNGSGGGGCMFAYAPGRQDEVCEAMERVGGKAYKVVVDTGARVEDNS